MSDRDPTYAVTRGHLRRISESMDGEGRISLSDLQRIFEAERGTRSFDSDGGDGTSDAQRAFEAAYGEWTARCRIASATAAGVERALAQATDDDRAYAALAAHMNLPVAA